MRFLNKTLVAFGALASLSAAQSNVTCQNGLHIIVARASVEQPGYGILNSVKNDILDRVPESDSVAVPYPATIMNPIYFQSEPEGVGNLTELIKEYGDACPQNKMALLGYSQGAHVIGDTLIGSQYDNFPVFPMTPGIDQKYIDNIVAVVMMGDPANVADQPFLVGNSTRNGTFPRNNTELWSSTGLASKMVSYCDAEDTFCDSGNEPNSLAIHIGYTIEYGKQAADFVVEKAMGNTSANGTSGTNGTATPTTSVSGSPTTTSGMATTTSPSSTTAPNSAFSIRTKASTYVLVGLLQCALAFVMFY